MKTKGIKSSLEEILIVREFLNVFPEEIPGIPPLREVEFYIDLTLEPHLAVWHRQNLRNQRLADELLDKGIFGPVHLHGEPRCYL